MTIREHLVVLLQEIHAFHRDVLPLLDSLRHLADDERVRRVLQTQHDGIRGECETANQSLEQLGARFTMGQSVLAFSLKEASERFRHQMSPSRAQLDIHALLIALAAAGIARSKYQGAVGMALALGEQQVARMLEEMDQREVMGQGDLGDVLPQLIQEAGAGETREAA
jgi:ferritin-like metal-binding protein YciE